jgi:TPR repeat protein
MRSFPVILCLFWTLLCLPAAAQEEKPLSDYVKALMEKAGEGDAVFQDSLGVCYLLGEGVLQDDKEAVKWFHLAAEQGYAPAQYNLGLCYLRGEGVLEDRKEAVKWYRKAADQGHAMAQYALGLHYSREGAAQDYKEAVKWHRKAADQGHADSQYYLGVFYLLGEGVLQDDKEAVKWFHLAAEQGHAPAQAALGDSYANGEGVLEDDKEAVKWFRLAAEQGYAGAQCNLGVCYDNGEGVLEDDKEAVKWYRLAAEQGDADSQYYLGVCYDNGEGVLEDDKEAVKWYRLAAEQGDADSQYYLGVCYDNGEGVLEDDKEAVKWYRLAAEQGDADSQYYLGVCYDNGEGVLEDDKEAVKWYRLAAEQGHAGAQNSLGAMYSRGEGVLLSDVDAYAWFSISAFNGDELGSQNRALWAKRMTPAQIAAAQELSKTIQHRIEARLATSGAGAGPAAVVREAHAQPVDAFGTGFVVTKSGYLITAHHVIADASQIRVTFGDGRTFPAKVEVASRSNDLALLKIKAEGLKFLPLSSSKSIEVGEELFTVGYPVPQLLGGKPKYTNGALSSKSGIKGEASLMQVTIPIQPGNSGGPVVTSKGRVVGIVTSTAAIEAFFKETGTLPQNINWAIKAEYASLMFEAKQKAPDTSSLEKAIERALGAVCLIEVWNEPK